MGDVIKIAQEAKRAKFEAEDEMYNFKPNAKRKSVSLGNVQ